METFWFAVVTVMLATYVALDGFDFGAGILHRYVARSDDQRRTVLSAIGPFWDGNEVWLVAAGGVLFFTFPRAYAAAFSGFYLPMMAVLWLLMFRGLGIEFRSHFENALWREFWDTAFSLASAAMAVVLGTALGNMMRGVPLKDDGYFAIPLFTNFRTSPDVGVFDWYTLSVALFSLLLLAGHGALYLVWKTSGAVQARSRALADRLWPASVVVWALVTGATAWLRPDLYTNLGERPWMFAFAVLIASSLFGVFRFHKRGHELAAFLSSSVFVFATFSATMAGNYPRLLYSNIDPAHSITADNAASGKHGLQVGMVWWCVGAALAIGYFVFLFRSFSGKVGLPSRDSGH